ncbi:MAG: hypothetical protein QXY05_02125 [Candidatus Anstonellales archaeon]
MRRAVFIFIVLSFAFSLTLDEYAYNHLYENETYEIEEVAYELKYYYIVIVNGNLSNSFVVCYEGENFCIVENATLISKILNSYYSKKISESEMEEFRKKLLIKIDAFDKSRKSEIECAEYFQNCSSLQSCESVAVHRNQSKKYAEAILNLTSNSRRINELVRPFSYTPENFEQMLAGVMEVNILSQQNTRNELVLDGICGPFVYNTTALIEAREMLEEKRGMIEARNKINETAAEMAEQGEKRGLIPPRITDEKIGLVKKAQFEIVGEAFKDEGVTLVFRRGVERIPDEKITITYPSGKKLAMRTDYAGEIKIKLSEAGTYFLEAENHVIEKNSFEVRIKETENYDIVIYTLISVLIVVYLFYKFILAPQKTSSS